MKYILLLFLLGCGQATPAKMEIICKKPTETRIHTIYDTMNLYEIEIISAEGHSYKDSKNFGTQNGMIMSFATTLYYFDLLNGFDCKLEVKQ